MPDDLYKIQAFALFPEPDLNYCKLLRNYIKTEIYFSTNHVCIWYCPGNDLGGALWTGQVPSEEIREAFLKCTELVTLKNKRNWLADNRKMAMMSQEDQEWIALMAPSILNSGLRKMATLVSEDIFHHMAIVELFDQFSGQLTFQNHYFKQLKEALEWLGFGTEEPILDNLLLYPLETLNLK